MTEEQESLVEALRAALVGDAVDVAKVDRRMIGLVEFGSGNPGEKGLGEMQLTERGRLVLDLATDRDNARAMFAGHNEIVERSFRLLCDAIGRDKEDADDIFKSAKLSYLPEYVAALVEERDLYRLKAEWQEAEHKRLRAWYEWSSAVHVAPEKANALGEEHDRAAYARDAAKAAYLAAGGKP